MDKTTESASMSTEIKEGVHIKGKDAIFLDTPKILFPENAPLDYTEKRELYEILNELFQDGGEGGDWQPPAWWIPVPEPQEYEMYFLIYANTSNNFGVMLSNNEKNSAVKIKAFFDWGDGTTEEIEGSAVYSTFAHQYKTNGQYLVKVTTNSTSNYLTGFINSASQGMPIQIAKIGEQTVVSTQGSANYPAFRYQYALNYLVVNGDYDKDGFVFTDCRNLKKINIKNPPTELAEFAFSGCTCLRDNAFKNVTEKLTAIPKGAFVNCVGLKKIDTICTEIKDDGFNGCFCLNSVNAPNCTAMGKNAFLDNYSLNEITYANGCTFGEKCFNSCYSLYPVPTN